MDLKTFVRDSVLEIFNGLDEASRNLNESLDKTGRPGAMGHLGSGNALPTSAVDFDVAVTVTTESTTGRESGISVAGFSIKAGIGGEVSSQNQNSTVSRIKFSVPVTFPSR